jgi:hypothetical protein
VQLPKGTFRYDRFVYELSAASGIDIVADYYTRRLVSCSGERKTIQDYLLQLKSDLNLQPTWTASGLRLKCRDWYEVADYEPTAEAADLLEAAAREKEGPTLNTLLRIVSRSNSHQLATLERHTFPDGKRPPLNWVSRIYGNAPWLRLFAQLPQSAQKMAQSEAGYRFLKLPPASIEPWRQVAVGRALISSEAPQLLAIWRQTQTSQAFADWPRVPQLRLGIGNDRKNSVGLWREMVSY